MIENLFLGYASLWHPLAYVAVFLAMVIEGEISLFTVAFLTHREVFTLETVIPIVIGGALAGDLFWYWLGWRLKQDSLWGMRVAKVSRHFDNHLSARPMHAIFLSKFTYGFNRLVLVRAGMQRLQSREFLKSGFVAVLLWIAIVGAAGYASGAAYILVKRYLKYAEVGFLVGLVLFFLLWKFVLARELKKKL